MPFGHCNFIDFRFQVSHRQMFNITNSLQSHRMVSATLITVSLHYIPPFLRMKNTFSLHTHKMLAFHKDEATVSHS